MDQEKRQAVLVSVLMTILAGVGIWSARWMMRERGAALSAASDWAECERLKNAILSLREEPAAVAGNAMASQELGERIAAASRQAQLPNGPPRDVFPQSPQSLGDSTYVLESTLIRVRDVSLSQLAAFLYHLTEESVLRIEQLRLRAPHGADAKELWDAEVTIAYLRYESSAGRRY